VTGSKGWIEVNPGFQMEMGFEHFTGVPGQHGEQKESHEKFSETDHFGGETKYFSECILADREPEPDGEEGWLDVRVILAIRRAIETGKPQKLAPYTRTRQIDPAKQKYELSKVRAKLLVDAAKPSEKEPPQGSEIAA
jgi:hypothetical protein